MNSRTVRRSSHDAEHGRRDARSRRVEGYERKPIARIGVESAPDCLEYVVLRSVDSVIEDLHGNGRRTDTRWHRFKDEALRRNARPAGVDEGGIMLCRTISAAPARCRIALSRTRRPAGCSEGLL